MKLCDIVLEANPERDYGFRKEASRIYNKIVPHLLDYFHRNFQSLKITLGGGAIKSNVVRVDKTYDLDVFLQYSEDSSWSGIFNGHSTPPYIVVYPYNPHSKKIRGEADIKETFIHEFIHYLDWLRSNHYNANTSKLGSGTKEYYNHPAELNAYFQEGTRALEQFMNKNKQYMRYGHVWESFSNFIKFLTRKDGSYYFYYFKFTDNLDEKNAKKIQQRLYQTWEYLSKDYKRKIRDNTYHGNDKEEAEKEYQKKRKNLFSKVKRH